MDYIKQFNRKQKRKKVFWTVCYILAILIIVFVVLLFVCQKTQILGNSMNPNMKNGDEVLINKFTYDFSEPKRFDIIVFKFKYLADTLYVKRIIGLPGETVQIKDGVIYINDERLEEEYGFEPYIYDPGLASDPIELGPDEYFVLGDNRNISKDSRDKTVFKVKKADIVGKAWIRVYPLDRVGVINHRKASY